MGRPVCQAALQQVLHMHAAALMPHAPGWLVQGQQGHAPSHCMPRTPTGCSGVLDVAASVVALLRRFFPEHIDALEPEQAFLEVGAGCSLTAYCNHLGCRRFTAAQEFVSGDSNAMCVPMGLLS